MPSVEMVRMTSSGTEATMSAIRLARAATGRDKIVKFAGAYHGHVDGLLAEAGSRPGDAGHPGQPGRHRRRRPRTRWSCRGTTPTPSRAALAEHELAAVIAEPYPGQHGPGPARRGLPRAAARAAPTEHGALLIFDEVITGFRVARGGAQELHRRRCPT